MPSLDFHVGVSCFEARSWVDHCSFFHLHIDVVTWPTGWWNFLSSAKVVLGRRIYDHMTRPIFIHLYFDFLRSRKSYPIQRPSRLWRIFLFQMAFDERLSNVAVRGEEGLEGTTEASSYVESPFYQNQYICHDEHRTKSYFHTSLGQGLDEKPISKEKLADQDRFMTEYSQNSSLRPIPSRRSMNLLAARLQPLQAILV